MGKRQNNVVVTIDTLKLKITFMRHTNMKAEIVECNHWLWAGPEETSVDVFRVYGGRLVRSGGYNNVTAVEEV